MEKYRNSCGTSSLNRSYPLPTSRFLNTGPLYTMGSFSTNLQQQQQQQQGPQLLMNTNSVGTATQFQFVPARHQHTANNFSASPLSFDIGNSIAPLVNSVKTFFSNLLKPTIRTDTTYATVNGSSSDPTTETRKCNSAPNIYMGTMSDSKCAGDFEKSCFVDKVDYEMLSKLSSSTKSFSDYNLPISAVKSSSYCNSNHSITQPADKVTDITKKSVQRQEQQQPIPLQHTTKESNVKISPTPSPVANPQATPNAISISSINIPTVPNMTRKCDKKRPKKEKGGKKAKRRSGKNQKEKGKHALALNIHEDCETETLSTDEWDEPLVIISASSTETTTIPSVQSSSDPITFSTDDFPAMPTHCPSANIQTLPRLSHCVAALIGKRPQRQISECDSEDSFIVFDNDDKQTPSSVESNLSFCDRIRNRLSMGGRQRQISESSDDDFICFEMEGSDADGVDNDGDDDDEDDGSDCDEEALTSVSDCESEVDVKSSGTNPPDSGFEDKKVRFNLKPVVHVLRTWRFAYQQARKGEWEQYGRDRVRFYDRIKRLESTLAPILNSDHRQRIYCERFLQTAVNDSGVQGGAIDKQ